MAQTFSSVFKIKALQDKLPFGLDFTIRQVTSEVTENVAGFQLPVINDLTSGETWFFEGVESINKSQINEASLGLRSLAKKLQVACSIENLDTAIGLLFEPTDELAESNQYSQFIEDNYQEIKRLAELSRVANNTASKEWLRLTFFLLSRYDGNWQISDTAMLKQTQIDALNEFILREASGGNIESVVSDDTDVKK